MKRIVILIGLLLMMSLAWGQDFYTIQVRSLSHEAPLTMDELQMGMWQAKVDGQMKCFMGRYAKYDEAKAALVSIKNKNYKDVFVVSSDKIFGVGEDSDAANTEDLMSMLEEDDSHNFANQYKEGEQLFTIQIAAYRYPLYMTEFNLEEEVYEFFCNDNIYRYTVGKFYKESDARKRLSQIKESGFPDAFLVDYNKYASYRLE